MLLPPWQPPLSPPPPPRRRRPRRRRGQGWCATRAAENKKSPPGRRRPPSRRRHRRGSSTAAGFAAAFSGASCAPSHDATCTRWQEQRAGRRRGVARDPTYEHTKESARIRSRGAGGRLRRAQAGSICAHLLGISAPLSTHAGCRDGTPCRSCSRVSYCSRSPATARGETARAGHASSSSLSCTRVRSPPPCQQNAPIGSSWHNAVAPHLRSAMASRHFHTEYADSARE